MSEKFGFGKALEHLEAQRRVARDGWNGKGMFIVMMPRLQLPPFSTQGTDRKVNDRTAKWIGEDTDLDCNPYIAMWTADKKWQPGWLASQTDMLAKDWVCLDAAPEVLPMPGFARYRSHKVAEAAEIVTWGSHIEKDDDGKVINQGPTPYVVLIGGANVNVPGDIFARYKPKQGDFLVRYPDSDGYLSISPRQAFLDGYTRISHE